MATTAPSSTLDAARAARDALAVRGRAADRDERGMAALARGAVFEEALLGALRARFAELRTAAR